MKKRGKIISICVVVSFLNLSCAHQVVINSNPSGAKVTIDGEYKGKTPITFEEKTGAGKEYSIKLEKEGYNPVVSKMVQDNWNDGCMAGSVAGGLLVCLPIFGLFWSRQLRDNYIYELEKTTPETSQTK